MAAHFTKAMLKAFKFRIYPNKKQQSLLEEHFGATRFIYNLFLEKKITAHKENKRLSWTSEEVNEKVKGKAKKVKQEAERF